MNKTGKTLIIIAGTLIGALVGVKVALNLVKEMEENEGRFPLSGSASLKVGLNAFNVMQQLTGKKG
ncbi:MAG TPA: hypothetical protein PKI51_00825 [Anaerolineaceae bacterium]|nr:hypothetical protein [Anaerolineaceae bacterium]